jgi:Outer membrane cobalamin receptor protein
MPGIEFTRTEGVSNSITFNGLGANYLLILIDGERMAGETQRSNPDFNRIDIDNVERIEIVKGAMSTLYGSGAVAGIINIITKKAEKPFQAGLEALYSGEGERRLGASTGFKKGKISSYTSAVANLKQKYFFKDTEIEGFKNISISEKLNYTIPDKLNIGLRGTFYTHQRHNAGLIGELVNDLYRNWNLLFTGEIIIYRGRVSCMFLTIMIIMGSMRNI